MDIVLAAAILGLVALVAARLEQFNTLKPIGAAKVGDGDSLELAGERIRLRGIDAPELTQVCRAGSRDYPCGRMARDALGQLAGAGQVSCEGWERDRYGRLLALCSAGGVELNREQVALGWAVAYGDYRREETSARAARRGMWAGEFERPSEWRVRHGDVTDPPHDLLATIRNWLRQLFAM
jgi:endonuclease YncB( thermonuclease family)